MKATGITTRGRSLKATALYKFVQPTPFERKLKINVTVIVSKTHLIFNTISLF